MNSRHQRLLRFASLGGIVAAVCGVMWRNLQPPLKDAFGAAAATVLIQERTIDRGKVRMGTPVRCTFHLFNTSPQPRRIVRVLPGCSCTKVIHFTEALESNSWGEVTVEIDTVQKVGLRSSSILIETDDPQRPQINPLVKCQVLPSIQVLPPRLEFRPVLQAGEFPEQSVEFAALYEDEHVQITSVEPSDPSIAAVQKPSEASERTSLSVRVHRDIPAGTTLAHLRIRLAGSAQREVRVPITVHNDRKLRTLPSVLKLTANSGKPQTVEFTIRTADADRLDVQRIAVPDRTEHVHHKRISDSEVRVSLVTKIRNSQTGTHLSVSTNHGTVRVPIIVASQSD